MKKLLIVLVCFMLLCAGFACGKSESGEQGGGLTGLFSSEDGGAGGKTPEEIAEAAATPRPTWAPTPTPYTQSGELNEEVLNEGGAIARITGYSYDSATGLICLAELENASASTLRFDTEVVAINEWLEYAGETSLGSTDAKTDENSANNDVILRPGTSASCEILFQPAKDRTYNECFPIGELKAFTISYYVRDEDSNGLIADVEKTVLIAGEQPSPALQGEEIYADDTLRIVSLGYRPEQQALYIAAEDNGQGRDWYSIEVEIVIDGYSTGIKHWFSWREGMAEPAKLDCFPFLIRLGIEQPTTLEVLVEATSSEDTYATCPITVVENAKGTVETDKLPIVLENDSLRIRKFRLFGPYEVLLMVENLTNHTVSVVCENEQPVVVDGKIWKSNYSSVSLLPGKMGILDISAYTERDEDGWTSRDDVALLDAKSVSCTLKANYYSYLLSEEAPPLAPTEITIGLS